MRLRTLDLFCGGGGSSWGAMRAGAEIVCGVDAWNVATETFSCNFPRARAVMLCMTERTRPADLGPIGAIDLILASPECTNHTWAKGARPRDEASRATARFVLNFARELTPRWLVIENVVSMTRWGGYEELLASLGSLGYHVLPQVLNAEAFGVPQARQRLFLLCAKRHHPAPVEQRSGRRACVFDILDPDGSWPATPLYRPGRSKATIARAERAIAALGRREPFLVVYYGSDGSGGWQPLDRPLRTITTIDRFGLVIWTGATPMLRMLQPPELSRAMGFDGRFKLPVGTRRDRVRLMGNGVCPPVMEGIVGSLVREATASTVTTSAVPQRRYIA